MLNLVKINHVRGNSIDATVFIDKIRMKVKNTKMIIIIIILIIMIIIIRGFL